MGSEGADAQESRHGGERDAKLLGDNQERQDHDGVPLEDLKAVSGAHTPPGRSDRPAANAFGTDNRS
jgi:hypothetical protein